MSYFVGIGAQKAATTWFHAMLERHPNVEFPLGKEAHYWDRPVWRRAPGTRWIDDFDDAQGAKAVGDITPAYATLEPGTVGEIAERLPNLRLFMSLRNPIERAWSSALMALRRAEMTIGEASDRWFLDHFHSAGSRARGDYATTLQNWRQHFGSDAVMVFLTEDVVEQPKQVLERLATHLSLSPQPFLAIDSRLLELRVFVGPGVPIRASLRHPLEDLYATSIEALGRDLDRDLSAWTSASTQCES